MSLVDHDVLLELESRAQNLLVTDLVWVLENEHEADEPGVSRDRVDAYVEELGESLDADALRAGVENQLTNSETWVSADALYEVTPDRISRYPRRWHERLGPDTEVVEYVRVLNDAMEDPQRSDASDAVAEEFLIETLCVLGDWDDEDAWEELEELRREDVLVEHPDQHPEAGVQLADES